MERKQQITENKFVKYQHVERMGNTEVANICEGECFVFPKIDGTNGSLWWCHESGLQAGSRNRHLAIDDDNANFYKSMLDCAKIKQFFEEHPDLRLFGEWLVPHSIKTYGDSAWRKFYIFDVMRDDKFLSYNEYQDYLEKHGLEYIPPIFKITNPSEERMFEALQKNTFLIKDGEGVGEGIVIKNYNFVNKFQNTVWAKLVTSEFKAKHTKAMGVLELNEKAKVEDSIAAEFVTKSIVDKVYAKIELENGGFSSKDIPRLLNMVFYDIIKEESWEILKKFKDPTIDFKVLRRTVFSHAKIYKPELF